MGSAKARTLAEKWARTAADRTAIERGCYFDQAAADRVCQFFEKGIRHSVGRWSGEPFFLLDWQRDWLSTLYGWMNPNGFRRFREAYLEVPKKQGKSTMLAGLCLLGIFEEDAAEVYVGATNKYQASIIYKECSRMVAKSPGLNSRLLVRAATKTILYPETHSRFEAMSADVAGRDGSNATTIVLDELHRFRSRDLYDISKYAGASRDQPLLINITTAGIDRFSICYELHQRAERIISGEEKDDIRFFGTIYGAGPDDDLDDERTWFKANPSMNQTIKIEDFRADYHEAKQIPAKYANFIRLRLNVWTDKVSKWLPVDLWDECGGDFGAEAFVGKRSFATLDLSSRSDLSTVTLTTDEGGRIRTLTLYFCPKEGIRQRSQNDGVPYEKWAAEGWLIPTEGNAVDHDAMREKVNDLRDMGVEIATIGMDPWNSGSLESKFEQDGYEVRMIAQRIGTLTSACKELERLILTKGIIHERNPVTRWMVGNAAVRSDAAGNIMPDKAKSSEKIDGVVSTVMGVGLAMVDSGARESTFTLL